MSDTQLLDLNDSEILRLESVTKILKDRMGTSRNLEHFRREAEERFAEIGFRVNVLAYDTNVQGVYSFDIEIVDRYEGNFDPEQQVHEVTNDILNLGTKGVLKTETTASGLHVVGGGHAGHKH